MPSLAPISGRRRRLAGVASVAAAALLAVLPSAGPSAAADTAPPAADADVTVNTQAGLGTLGGAARGVNAAIWDSHMNDPEVATLMKAAGVGAMRYPGGSYSDIYHWKDNTAPGGYVAPGTDFDSFMGTVKATGAQPVIIANYGSGTPEEAADWVRYANVEKEVRRQVLGDRQRDLRQRPLRQRLGERHPRRQEPGRVRPPGAGLRLRDEGRRPDREDRRGAHHARQLAGRDHRCR
ncbi:hypothetical protein [Peterkaempfera sp. SMS 1(5)a]|uniref:hypothetical protein n=1 Tax=Peterkaempfera podocarpi TaxID=3232308 RepID=UPI00366A5AD8